MNDLLKPKIDPIPHLKWSYNIGAGLDIPTGTFIKGKYGEAILNGGICNMTGLVGIGNTYKSLISNYMMFTILARFKESTGQIYDTEVNISGYERLQKLASYHDVFKNVDIIDSGKLSVTDKSIASGNKWFEIQKEFMNSKIANSNKITRESPFIRRDKMIIPTVTVIDSLTKFETDKTYSMQEDNELGSSDANTLYMKDGQDKKRLLNSLVVPIEKSNNPYIITAWISKNIQMDPRAAPDRKLNSLKNNDQIKGVSVDFTYLTTNCWQAVSSRPLLNDGTKQPEYPKSGIDYSKGDPELYIVTLCNLRSKVGMTGLISEIIISQSEGVLPTLTEFHYIKTNERFGIDGSLQHYNLDLLPDIKLSRTTVRDKIDSNPLLRRAINITSEICQIKFLYKDFKKDLLCTPKELYNDLKNKGFDWDILLSTRGWWTYDNDKQEIPFLSSVDLLRMRLPEDHPEYYFPYWLEKDKKTIKIIKDKK